MEIYDFTIGDIRAGGGSVDGGGEQDGGSGFGREGAMRIADSRIANSQGAILRKSLIYHFVPLQVLDFPLFPTCFGGGERRRGGENSTLESSKLKTKGWGNRGKACYSEKQPKPHGTVDDAKVGGTRCNSLKMGLNGDNKGNGESLSSKQRWIVVNRVILEKAARVLGTGLEFRGCEEALLPENTDTGVKSSNCFDQTRNFP